MVKLSIDQSLSTDFEKDLRLKKLSLKANLANKVIVCHIFCNYDNRD